MTRPHYYNEIDKHAAQWLRNLIAAGHLPAGEVDERSIEDVCADDIRGFMQCHFFAGIGGWPLALKLAGWPPDRPVWTGSCPCQPFSAAGKRVGTADERHLWPAWSHLIGQCRPVRIFGEQVASRDALGWWDVVHADLEDAGYACGAVDLCAAGVGAPHIRQRLYWVADSDLAHGGGARLEGRDARAVGDECATAERGRGAGELGHAEDIGSSSGAPIASLRHSEDQSQRSGFWSAADWIDCRDGKRRPVEPGTFPLAHGIQNRVGRLRAYGNAIVVPLAVEFVKAVME